MEREKLKMIGRDTANILLLTHNYANKIREDGTKEIKVAAGLYESLFEGLPLVFTGVGVVTGHPEWIGLGALYWCGGIVATARLIRD